MTDAPSAPVAAPRPAPKKKSSTVIIVVVCVAAGCCVFGGIGAALLLPAIVRAADRARTTMCANHQRQLWKMHHIAAGQSGNIDDIPHTGGAFWMSLSEGPKAMLADPSVLRCPVAEAAGNPDRLGFLGPGMPLKDVSDDGPVGGDKAGNHPEGGNILFKHGAVLETQDPRYSEFVGQLKP